MPWKTQWLQTINLVPLKTTMANDPTCIIINTPFLRLPVTGFDFVKTYKVSFHTVYGSLHTTVYTTIRKYRYTVHYTDRILKRQYTSVYLSVHIEYTDSLYFRIQAISCSARHRPYLQYNLLFLQVKQTAFQFSKVL